MILTTCKVCNKEFYSKSGRAKFCNYKCNEELKHGTKEGCFDQRAFEREMLIDHFFNNIDKLNPICVQVNRIKTCQTIN